MWTLELYIWSYKTEKNAHTQIKISQLKICAEILKIYLNEIILKTEPTSPKTVNAYLFKLLNMSIIF